MLTGFEEITKPLSEEERGYVHIIVSAFESMKKGKENAITSGFIIERLKTVNVFVDEPRLRKLIRYIRVNELILGVCSNSNGYFIAKDSKELLSVLKSLKERIEIQTDTFHALKKQYNKMNEVEPYNVRPNEPKKLF